MGTLDAKLEVYRVKGLDNIKELRNINDYETELEPALTFLFGNYHVLLELEEPIADGKGQQRIEKEFQPLVKRDDGSKIYFYLLNGAMTGWYYAKRP